VTGRSYSSLLSFFVGETWDEEHFLLGNVSVSGLDTNFAYAWVEAGSSICLLRDG